MGIFFTFSKLLNHSHSQLSSDLLLLFFPSQHCPHTCTFPFKDQPVQMNGGLSGSAKTNSSYSSKHTNQLVYSAVVSSSGDAFFPAQRHLAAPREKSTSGQKKQQYNSPIGLYSAETLQEMAMLQERAKSSGSGKPSGYVIMNRARCDASSQVW